MLSGERAYDTVYNENVLVGPAAEVGNSTRAFSRFCSGDLAGPEHGFDTHIYLTNEEEGTPSATFDTKGGLAVAIVDNNLYTLPKLGRFAWENSVTQPGRPSSRTAIMSMEDGPFDLETDKENSQVYMYVGTKVRPHASVLRRNGLDNGKLYVLAPVSSAQSSEAAFANGTIAVKWVEIVDAELKTEDQLESSTDAAGGIRFARPEDGAFNDRNRNEYFFVTTGSNGAATGALGNPNNLGRLYSLRVDRNDPTANGTLTVVVNADQVIAAGGDTAISPDNIGVSDDYLMINEDGTGGPTGSRQVMTAKRRDGSIWRFKLRGGSVGVDGSSAKRVAELDPPGRDGVLVLPGIWETSGIIDGDDLYGDGSWIFDVQAHPPTTAPAANTVEDGQLLLLLRADEDDDDDDDDEDDDD